MKHRLKLFLRRAWARVLFHTGLHALVNRLMPRRLTILFGHCVDEPACNGFLPPDMKIGRAKLDGLLDWFGKRYELATIGAGIESVAGSADGRSVVALSMDDGYRDNATALLPMLRERGVGATVFLESRPLDERRVNWSHKYFWMLSERLDPDELGRRYQAATRDEATAERLRRVLEDGGDLVYQLKRILKYDADRADRDRVIDELFREAGGDEEALCRALYMSWDEVRELERAGFELGGHTVHHEILSRLERDDAAAEIGGCRAALGRELERPGDVFAYPFGRRWDYRDETRELVGEAGFRWAVNTHAGTNDGRTDPTQLRRIPIDDGAELHMLVAEACGGFDLLRRFGIDLSE